ncbi:MAG: hypothetical protein KJP15_01880 [Gammaproteobacteria bacterium]|nr:hypothetical protein [Gammaproteobacteria bacterium]
MLPFLKNKHLIIAMLVAPVLAIIAYFAVDHVVSEKPHVAEQGKSYKLAAKSNCRYQSGQCTLENGDVEINVRVQRVTDVLIELSIQSNLPAQRVLASFTGNDETGEPVALQSYAPEKNLWSATFALIDPEKSHLRLALELAGAVFYAETPAVFIDYNTTYPRDNFAD